MAEERLLEVLRRDRDEGSQGTRQTWSTISRVEQFAVLWFLTKDAVEKRKKKRRRRTRRTRVVVFTQVQFLGWLLTRPLVCNDRSLWTRQCRSSPRSSTFLSWCAVQVALLGCLCGGQCCQEPGSFADPAWPWSPVDADFGWMSRLSRCSAEHECIPSTDTHGFMVVGMASVFGAYAGFDSGYIQASVFGGAVWRQGGPRTLRSICWSCLNG